MLTAVLLLLFSADAPKVEPDKDEVKALQGKWLVKEHEHGGKKTAAKVLANLSLEVSGSKMTTRDAGNLKEGTSIVAIDAKAKPATLDLKVESGSDAGKVVKAIYKLEGDTLTICVAEPGKDRPKAFAAREASGHTLMVFKKK